MEFRCTPPYFQPAKDTTPTRNKLNSVPSTKGQEGSASTSTIRPNLTYSHLNPDIHQSCSPQLEFEALFKRGGITGEWPGEPTWPLHQFLRGKQLLKQILNPYFKKSKVLQANIPALVYSHFLAFLFILWQVTTIPNCCQTWFKNIIIYIIWACLENWNTSRRKIHSREILRKYKTQNMRTSQSHFFSQLPIK